MSLSLQVKLLRVLQEREFERIGGLEKIKVDVRIIAATSANLKEMVARNEFRRDLYYRLNVIPVQMPALRERRTDIPALATYFVTKYCKSWGIETKAITQEAMKMLMNRMNQTTGLTATQTRLRPAEEFSAVPVELIQFAVSVTAVNVF